MRYDVIFMDIDNTLLDFHAGTEESLRALLQTFGLEATEDRLTRFHQINDRLWRQYEHGEIEKSHIFPTRFREYLGEMGIETDWLAANEQFSAGLRASAVLMPGAPELLDALKGRCRVYAVTNAVTTTQMPRLEKSGLIHRFDRIFISEQMGCQKPSAEFFDKVFAAIGPVDKSRCIILGDSLTSDMQGGRNAGIATCYFGKPTDDARCDYVIERLEEFLPLVMGT